MPRPPVIAAAVLAVSAALAVAAPAHGQGGDEWRRLMDGAVRAHQKGWAAGAETKLDAALAIAETFGEDDRRLAATLNALAVVYHDQGRYAEAAPLLERALAVEERALGPDHPDLAPLINALAITRLRQGEADAAAPLFRRALDLVEADDASTRLDAARILDNLAGALSAAGRYAEALPFYERALTIMEAELVPEHPTTVQTRAYYANALRMAGRDDEADALAGGTPETAGGADAARP